MLASRMAHYYLPIAVGVFFVVSLVQAIDGRVAANRLTMQLEDLRAETKRLSDEQRSLTLEYYTFADYANIHAAARELGMVAPSVPAGNFVYLYPPGAEGGRR